MAGNATLNGKPIEVTGFWIDGKSMADLNAEWVRMLDQWQAAIARNHIIYGTIDVTEENEMPVHAMHAFVEGDPETEFHIFDSSPGAHIVRNLKGEKVFLAKSLLKYKGEGKYEMPEWLAIKEELV